MRVRVGNLTMTNHPIHMHGYDFEVTCTDGGWVRPEARWPEVSIDIPVGAMRAFEFDADASRRLGDPLPQVASHDERHGPRRADLHRRRQERACAKKIRQVQPDYMAMGNRGMADMGEMEMPLPDNTLPMMTGFGQFGPIEMGGMFSVVKVREGLAADDYNDPGWYEHPAGTVAYEWTGDIPEPVKIRRRKNDGSGNSARRPRTVTIPATHKEKYRMIRLTALLPAFLLFASPALAAGTHAGGHHDMMAIGKAGEAAKAKRTVTITMLENDDGQMLFEPALLKVKAGETVRLKFVNDGRDRPRVRHGRP